MKKVKKILFWFLAVFLLATGILLTIVYIQRDDIQTKIIAEINETLTTPFATEEITLSFKKFPSASLLFKNIYSSGAYSNEQDTLIFAKEVFLEFGIWDIIFGDLNIQNISIEDASINIKELTDNRANYQVWRTDSDTSSSLFSIEKVKLLNIKCSYRNTNSNLKIIGKIDDNVINIASTLDLFTLGSKGKYQVDNFLLNKKSYLKNVELESSFELSVNPDSVTIKNAKGALAGIDFSLNYISTSKKSTLNVEQNNINLETLHKVVLNQGWVDWKKGEVKGTANAYSIINFKNEFSITSDFSINNSSLKGLSKAQVHNIKISGNYSYSNETNKMLLNSISAEGETGTLTANLEVQGFTKPKVKALVKSDLNLSELLLFFPSKHLKNPLGGLAFDIQFENQFGNVSSGLSAEQLKNAKITGSLILSGIGFDLLSKSKELRGMSGKLNFKNQALDFKNLFFKVGSSDIYLDGQWSKPLSFLAGTYPYLEIAGTLKSQEIQLEDFLIPIKNESAMHPLSEVKNLMLDIRLEAPLFSFKKFEASNIRSKLIVDKGIVKVKDLKLDADGGHFTGDFRIDTSYFLDANISLKKVDIKKLFTSFKNFGQDELTYKNVSGTLTSNISLNGLLVKDLSLEPKSIRAKTKFIIDDGEIKNYVPLRALSDYAEIDELRDVKFSRLEQEIQVANSIITIPSTRIESNILNLDISGSHTFNNEIDYILKLKLGDVLFAKKKKSAKKSEFDDYIVEEKTNDDPNIYVKITGTTKLPVVKVDKSSVSKSIKYDIKKQGTELKKLFKKDEEEDKKDPGFIYEWEEEDSK
jgi:hypothetical protein